MKASIHPEYSEINVNFDGDDTEVKKVDDDVKDKEVDNEDDA